MKQKFANALSLALIVAMLFTSVALADNVQNDVVAGGNDTITAGASTTINYRITANNGDGQTGCNAADSSPATITINTPAGVTVDTSGAPGNQATLTFTTCGTNQSAVFSSSTPSNYTITVSVSDSGTGTYNTSPATFILKVNAPANTAPTLNLPSSITAEATNASGAVVSYTATASDAQDGSLTPSCSPASGSTFGPGTTTVNCSVTDSGGMSASGSFTVTVQDTTAPSLDLPAPITQEATSASGAVVSYTASATDLVDGLVSVDCLPASGSTFPLGSTTVNCSATDSHDNTGNGSFSVTVQDTTAPTLNLPANISQEAAGPLGNVVTYVASATDLVDGPVAINCSPASGSTFPFAATTVNCSATDSHSNPATGSFSVTIADTTAPVIAAHNDESAEATGPGGAIVNYTAPATSDAVDGAGVASCTPASGSQFALGSTTVTCNASDAADNAATPTTFEVNVVDTTPPTISFITRTPANANGWNNSDVIVTWSCMDLVGVVSDSVSETVSTAGANQSVTGTCTDTSGNTASDDQGGINIDKTAPTASANAFPAANTNGWNNSDVTVSFSGTDGLSGIDFCATAVVLSSEGAGQIASGTCTDLAGNVSDPATKTINIDLTAPSVALVGGPANGGSYYFGAVPAAPTCSASDALSGIGVNCLVSGYSTALGSHTVSTSATDKAGNSASASATYTVLAWTLRGFYQPVDMNGVYNTVKNGSTVPLKFEIFTGSAELTDIAAIQQPLVVALVTCQSGAVEDLIETVATGGTSLRYDTSGGQFIFNWKTPSTVGKCYRVTMTTLDGSSLVAFFKLK